MTNPQATPPVAEGQVHAPLNKDRTPPYLIVGVVFAVISALVLVMVWFQFRGYFETKAKLFVVSPRSGLSMDPGSKVTYNGVPIGRVSAVGIDDAEGLRARVLLDIKPRYLNLLPANVET